jgi:hypothetical protein
MHQSFKREVLSEKNGYLLNRRKKNPTERSHATLSHTFCSGIFRAPLQFSIYRTHHWCSFEFFLLFTPCQYLTALLQIGKREINKTLKKKKKNRKRRSGVVVLKRFLTDLPCGLLGEAPATPYTSAWRMAPGRGIFHLAVFLISHLAHNSTQYMLN